MEEAAIHAGAVEESHSAAVGVREDALGAVFGGDVFEVGGDGCDGLGPGDAFELAAAFGASASERVEEAGGVVFAFEVFGDFAAEEALGDGVVWVAFEFGGVAGLGIDLDEERAGIGTIERADGMEPGGGHGVRVAKMEELEGFDGLESVVCC